MKPCEVKTEDITKCIFKDLDPKPDYCETCKQIVESLEQYDMLTFEINSSKELDEEE